MAPKPEQFTSSVWLRPPRAQTGQPTLSREQIVRAAIELLDAEGAAGLSMRRLGTRLGSGATSLYWHVANKDELLELAVDEVMGEIYVPEAGDTSWRIGASVWVNGMRSMLLRHPWVISLLGTHPTLGPNVMRLGERMVSLLQRAGFTGMELSYASSLLNSHVIGSATTEAAIHNATKRAGVSMTEMVEQVEPYLDALASDHPHYDKWRRETGVRAQTAESMLDDSFAFGLERVLDGLEAWLANRGAAGGEAGGARA